MRLRWLVALAFVLLAGAAQAHPYSTSRGEVDWNAKTERFEVSLEVLPEELVQMVGGEQKAPFRLDASPACDEAIAAYLRRHIAAVSPKSETARLIWIGKEVAFEATWLYFELVFEKPPASLEGLQLKVDLGLELSHEHLSALRIRRGEEQRALLFSRLTREIRL